MKVLILGLALTLLQACASGTQKLEKINPGMSFVEVQEIMGRRDSFKTTETDGATFTLYQYTNNLCNGHVSIYDKCDFFVIFKNGAVVETGVKDIRNHAPNMTYMYMFR